MRRCDALGVEMIPIRLVISIAVIGAIVGLWASGMLVAGPTSDAGLLRRECEGAVSTLASLVRGGAARDLRDPDAPLGTRRIVTFDVPAGCVYLSFGGDPDPDGDGVMTSEAAGSSAVIVFLVQGAGKEAVWLSEPVGFRAGVYDGSRYILGPGSLILHTAGKARLAFELVRDAAAMYILVYPD
jgi:hypothetical protein